MSRLNWNRPANRIAKEKHKPYLSIDPRGKHKTSKISKQVYKEEPVRMNNVMNFGKYKGFTIKAIPTGYLEWLISVTEDDKQALIYAKELANRPEYIKKHKL